MSEEIRCFFGDFPNDEEPGLITIGNRIARARSDRWIHAIPPQRLSQSSDRQGKPGKSCDKLWTP
ncbi:MAG TPA: hypothetical protein VIL55_09975, partial [Naasia sp.]